MGRPTFTAYVGNIQAKTSKTPDEFWKLATRKGFVKRGKVVAKRAEMMEWPKSDVELGRAHASFVITHLRLRAGGEGASPRMKKRARAIGYER